MKIIERTISQVEFEMSVLWVSENPALFKVKYDTFFKVYSKDYDITAKVTKGFITLVGTRKQI